MHSDIYTVTINQYMKEYLSTSSLIENTSKGLYEWLNNYIHVK